MAGHSHWAGIKHKKEVVDKKRGKEFSKLLTAISVAAKSDPNPEFNPRLRSAIETAKNRQVPKDAISRAIARATESGENLEEVMFGAYGEGGVAILIEVATDNRNRAVQAIKQILNEHGGKWTDSGSVMWAFTEKSAGPRWQPKFPQKIEKRDVKKLRELLDALRAHDDVQEVYINADI